MTLTPFRIRIDPARLTLLEERLAATLWPNVPAGAEGHGIAVDRVRELIAYWREDFRWNDFAASLERFDHLVHARAPRPAGLPILPPRRRLTVSRRRPPRTRPRR
jgi:hypothetical protein